uniref:Thioesterase domain-containing protein n=1 Tax=Pyrodinium bahamense TaxID=73915 RepID=A0A7S0FG62_9DINO|mmetsp:Transcript_28056/g.77216  ORF Transcript_28056/g.77216 Transcript_28056/m.77216 type:complete len:172 (+) Transcript_28056:82-597(+)
MSNVCRLGQLFSQYVQQTRAQNSFSLAVSKRLNFLGSSDNLRKGTFQFPLHQSDCHAFALPQEGQTVHGGVIATVVEDATTLHLCAADIRGRKAVTTDLNLSYLGVGKVGRTLEINSSVLKVGGVLGVAQAEVKDVSTGKLIAVGRHTMMFMGEDGSATEFSQSLNSVFDV